MKKRQKRQRKSAPHTWIMESVVRMDTAAQQSLADENEALTAIAKDLWTRIVSLETQLHVARAELSRRPSRDMS